MFYRTGDQVVGVLCNWDLAEATENLEEDNIISLDYKSLAPILDGLPYGTPLSLPDTTIQEIREGIQRQKPRLINGTRSFISTDLLDVFAPPHAYRHDLESFFWALIWFVANHDRSTLTMQKSSLWTNTNIGELFAEKIDFLMKNEIYNEVLISSCRKNRDYSDMIHFHLNRLRHLVRRTHMRDANLKFLRMKRQEAITQGNAELDAKYREEMITLVGKVAGKELTYDRFIEILHASPTRARFINVP